MRTAGSDYDALVTTASTTAAPARGRGALALAVAIPVLLFLSLVSWAFASPVGSSPDDDFHLPSIWCGLGERPGLCAPGSEPETRSVLTPLTDAACFAFKPEVSGSCWNPSETGMSDTPRVNVGLYPPLFYGTMSIFASDDIQTSVLVIRIFNSALTVGVLSAVFFALPRRLRPALVVSAVGSAVPLGMFVAASTNPSAWAYISAATVWVCLYGAMLTDGRRRWALAGLAVLGGVMGAGARADSAAYALLSIVLAVILGARKGRSMWAAAAAAIVIAVAAVGFYLSARQGSAVVTGLSLDPVPLTIDQHISNFLNIPTLLAGALGGWGLGWLDTYMPSVVSTLSLMVAAGAIFVGARGMTPRRVIAFALSLIALYLVPFVLLAQSQAMVGAQVQPRYILPLLVIFLGVASVGVDIERSWTVSRITFAGVGLSVAMVVALHVGIRRYTTGVDDPALSLGARAEWWWNGIPSPTLVWAAGSAALIFAFVLLGVVQHRTLAAARLSTNETSNHGMTSA
ncbi:putative membrane protein DUF2142 [Microbacterium sp. AG157]|nr:putative membrane protein DUF2142 [Microbacterium sp. AG157]